jgi:hypothetical protein
VLVLFAGGLAAVVTAGLLVVVLVGGPGLDLWNMLTLVPGGAAAVLAILRPDRPLVLAVSAGLLAIAFAAGVASVGWFYLPSLVLLLAGLALLRRRSRA